MAIEDKRQRFMPVPDDREANRGKALAYPEAILLFNPVEPNFKGEVNFLSHFLVCFHIPGKEIPAPMQMCRYSNGCGCI